MPIQQMMFTGVASTMGTIVNPLTPTPSGYDEGTTSASSSISINADGTWDTTGITQNNGDWLVGGDSNNYECRITRTSGDLFTSNIASSWVSCSVNRQAYVTQTGNGSKTVFFTVEIRRVSDQVVVSTTAGCGVLVNVTNA